MNEIIKWLTEGSSWNELVFLIQEVHEWIRGFLQEKVGVEVAQSTRIIYGGFFLRNFKKMVMLSSFRFHIGIFNSIDEID